MWILIIILATAQGGASATTQEMSSYQSCYAAKQAIEATMPTGVSYNNQRTVSCVAK